MFLHYSLLITRLILTWKVYSFRRSQEQLASGACGSGGDAIIKQIPPQEDDDLLLPSPLSNTVKSHIRAVAGQCSGYGSCNSIVKSTSQRQKYLPPSLTTRKELLESCDGGDSSCRSIIDSTPSWQKTGENFQIQDSPVASFECFGGNDGVGSDGAVGGGNEGGSAALCDPPVSRAYEQKMFRPIQPAGCSTLSPTRSFWALEQPQVLA